MGFWNKYPYTSNSEINLDYFCNKLIQLEKAVADVIARVIRLENRPSGGSSDYDDLTDKPKINNVELSGNKTASQLGLATPADIPTVITDYDDLTDKPQINSVTIQGNHLPEYYNLQKEISILTAQPGWVCVMEEETGDIILVNPASWIIDYLPLYDGS